PPPRPPGRARRPRRPRRPEGRCGMTTSHSNGKSIDPAPGEHQNETPGEPPVIPSNAVFTIRQAGQRLGLKESCLPREARLGRLPVSRPGGRYFALGSWLIAWLEGGAPTKQRRRNPVPGDAGD